MIGQRTVYDRIPYFFSDQYDFGMEYRGWTTTSDEVVFRRGESDHEFIAFWLRDERVVAGMNANIWDQGDAIERLITEAVRVDRSKLADPDVDLAQMAKGG